MASASKAATSTTTSSSSSALQDPTTSTSTSATKSTSNVSSERDKKRISIRSTNSSINDDGNYASPIKGPFDSNLKKNTAFVKRVRQNLGIESKDQFLKETNTLGLDKYREEIIGALPEGMAKCATGKDVVACMEVSNFKV